MVLGLLTTLNLWVPDCFRATWTVKLPATQEMSRTRVMVPFLGARVPGTFW
jgi:hypothetical protein